MRYGMMMPVLALAVAGCMTPMKSTQSMQDFFPVFFQAGTAVLSPDAQTIVRQAASNAVTLHATRIEIAVPANAPRGPNLTEGRFTAIQNILSASGVAPGILARGTLSSDAAMLAGGGDRAEIKLIH